MSVYTGLLVKENSCTVIKQILDKRFLSLPHNKCGENTYKKNCGLERNSEYKFPFEIERKLSLLLM